MFICWQWIEVGRTRFVKLLKLKVNINIFVDNHNRLLKTINKYQIRNI